ncbi:hypothetical protein NW845_10770 [Synechococcus sp. H60.2]|uniref:hypothetical protein n=1 Tax=Synechococcus sp. H60.2 TaxID=2964518 RepID=UPI0039C01D58
MEVEEELKALRARVRNLERSLAESEALSLQQIECTHRLERQLLEAQAQLQEREQALQACQEEKARLEQRPTLEAFQLQQQHIEELQNLLWEMERRPTLEHYQILQQQLQTSQAEIETLKAELQRRVDPARFYQLQQELLELKQQANQLGEYAVKLPQVQLLQAQLQLRIQELEKEKAQLQAQIQELAGRPSAQEMETLRTELEAAHRQAEAEWQRLKVDLESEKARLQADLNAAQQRLRELEERPSHEQWASLQAELNRLRQQASFAKAERATLLAELQQSQQRQAEQTQQIAKLEAELQALRQEPKAQGDPSGEAESLQAQQLLALKEQVQALTRELDALRADRDQLLQELAQRPTFAQWQEVQQQVRELAQRPTRESLEEAQRARELAEAHYLVSQKQLEKLQQQVATLKTECVQAHAYAQTQEKEVALLLQRNQELEEQLAALRQSSAAPPQAVVELRSGRPAQERVQAVAEGPAPSPPTSRPTTGRTPAGGIPPLTLKEEQDHTERLLKRSVLATGCSGGERGERSRIELPTFVQRRLYSALHARGSSGSPA